MDVSSVGRRLELRVVVDSCKGVAGCEMQALLQLKQSNDWYPLPVMGIITGILILKTLKDKGSSPIRGPGCFYFLSLICKYRWTQERVLIGFKLL